MSFALSFPGQAKAAQWLSRAVPWPRLLCPQDAPEAGPPSKME